MEEKGLASRYQWDKKEMALLVNYYLQVGISSSEGVQVDYISKE